MFLAAIRYRVLIGINLVQVMLWAWELWMANVIELALQSLEDQQSTCYPFCNMHSYSWYMYNFFPPILT